MKRMMALFVICMLTVAPMMVMGGEESGMDMEALMAAATPGEHHQHLARWAGDFTYQAKAWMEPDAEPQEWSGERSAKMIMGGRYLQEEVTGSFMGMPFEGMALYAYDNMAGEYIAMWIDNMGTTVTEARGSCSEAGWVFEGTHMVPGMEGESAFKEVIRRVDDDNFVFEWHEAFPGMDEMVKTMEIAYTRKK